MLTGADIKKLKVVFTSKPNYIPIRKQLARHEHWIKQIARKVGVVLAE
ncbi:MAG: hypothetical protein Q7S01_01505 [bacterium]|nr:hypothetical protein [bacterium]